VTGRSPDNEAGHRYEPATLRHTTAALTSDGSMPR
jgi:hypothetical protein